MLGEGDLEGSGSRSGTLRVTDVYTVSDTESYDLVDVWGTGTLKVPKGAVLESKAITLDAGSVMLIEGGDVTVTSSVATDKVRLSGQCKRLEVTEGSTVTFQGPQGGNSISISRGGSVLFDVVASEGITIENATVNLTAGDAYSRYTAWTSGDLGGWVLAGGNATLRLNVTGEGGVLSISDSVVKLTGGTGAEAADGGPASGSSGNVGGKGGGYTSGGDVSGFVGAGGSSQCSFGADEIELSNCTIDLLAGNGGEAGDVIYYDYGDQAGTGGGGYSGSDGANGLTTVDAGDGGAISDDVGSGGDAVLIIHAGNLSGELLLVRVAGGNGGDAGNGGESEAAGAAGGGGYSGGGGGSYWGADGGDGGPVSGRVGSGGTARCLIWTTYETWLSSCTLMTDGGNGGNAGDGGDSVAWYNPYAGAGGGGYSGGGGGGEGPGTATSPGNDGGNGGPVSGDVAVGGRSAISFSSQKLIGSNLTIVGSGGDGGDGGANGTSKVTVGGGGGSYSAGGGGGNGVGAQPSGFGGNGGPVTDNVGDGGASSLSFNAPYFSLDALCWLTVRGGEGGDGSTASASGTFGGKGLGRTTSDGSSTEDLPMSRPFLISPPDGHHQVQGPLTFKWSSAYRSTTNGGVVGYSLEVDDDIGFSSPVISNTGTGTSFSPASLAGGDYYWRVKAVYSTPSGATPGWTDPFLLKWGYNNAPIVRNPLGKVFIMQDTLDVPVVDLKDVFFDPDGDALEYTVSGNQRIAITIAENGSVLATPDPGYLGWEHITIKAREVLDVPLEVEDVLNLSVVLDTGPLRISTHSLPDAVEDTDYGYILTTSGIYTGDTLTWDMTSSAPFLQLHPSTGRLSGTPGNEHVGTYNVDLTVSDGEGSTARRVLPLEVLNTNDPPEITSVDVATCVEGEPYKVEYEATDIDPTEDVLMWEMTSNASFLSMDRRTGVLFGDPRFEDIGTYWVNVTVRDGNGGNDTHSFTLEVQPSNFPPRISDVPIQTITEDEDFRLDLSPYISDVDTPMEHLTLECSHPNVVAIDGLNVTLHYSRWQPGHELEFLVLDGPWRMLGTVTIDIIETNDPPVLKSIPAQLVPEDQSFSLDLSLYVSDEDTTQGELRVETDHDNVIHWEGLTLTMLYEKWEPPHDVAFTIVDDGIRVEGSFEVFVQERNDPPVITGLGDLLHPYSITLDEGDSTSLVIHVEDEEGDELELSIRTDHPGTVVDAVGGVLVIEAAKGKLGEFYVDVMVSDGRGGEANVTLNLTVLNVNDAPEIDTLRPASGTTFDKGDTVTLSARASDVDGDELTYTWTLDGRVLGTGQDLDLENLGSGRHNITLTVTDPNGGEAVSHVEVEVVAAIEGTSLWLIIAVVLVVVAGVSLFLMRDHLTR